jgi:hypothetical protein
VHETQKAAIDVGRGIARNQGTVGTARFETGTRIGAIPFRRRANYLRDIDSRAGLEVVKQLVAAANRWQQFSRERQVTSKAKSAAPKED